MQEQRAEPQIQEPEEHTCSAASAPGPTTSGKGPSKAPLYGRLTGERCRKTVTLHGFETVESSLETSDGSVRTVLHRDGTVEVYVASKYDPRELVYTGNVNAGEVANLEASDWRMDA
jgi:hypothetical protein